MVGQRGIGHSSVVMVYHTLPVKKTKRRSSYLCNRKLREQTPVQAAVLDPCSEMPRECYRTFFHI